ncbi:MAG: tRNA (guanosine(46)-N7)-methyltransferase TrmB [Rhodospirillales bacterium]
MDDTRAAAGPPRFYGRRRGKPLSPARRALVETALPGLRVPVTPVAPEARGGDVAPEAALLDPFTLFTPRVRAVRLEIGFGAGEHLVHQAAAHPDAGFIGCEPFINGVASALSLITQQGLQNVRLFDDDARLLLPRLAAGSVEQVFILFPDPWPKKRHWRRRFINAEILDNLARITAPGGGLRFATDHAGYAAWALERLIAHPGFEWTAERADDWRTRPIGAAPTRYETKSLAGPPVYLNFRRV